MNGLFQVAESVQTFCRARERRFCFIGGLAAQRWGEPRQTLDVVLTVLTGFGSEEVFVDKLLAAFEARVEHPREFALTCRVLLLRSPSGVGIDLALGALPFEERAVNRSNDWRIDDQLRLATCSAEDLVVYKAFAGRPQDWVDIERIVVRQGPSLDRGLVRDEIRPLLTLKETPQDLERLDALLIAET